MREKVTQPVARLGSYELIYLLGEGGMAEVWRAASHGAAGFVRPVALKLMRPTFVQDQNLVDLFVSEAKLSARLDHPNVVTTLDFGCVVNRYFMAMELVEGVPLRSVIKGNPRGLDADLCVHVALCVARALDHAWNAIGENGSKLEIVHRDVNPANVLLSSHGEVKLADFGIAKASDAVARTSTGVLRGKLAYMSPEQARIERLDARSDLFALGLTLSEMLTGRRAFGGRDEHEILEQSRTGITTPLPDDVPVELRRIVARATAPRAEDRYASAAEMATWLADYAAQRPPLDATRMLSALVSGVPSTPRLGPMIVPARRTDAATRDATEDDTAQGFIRQGSASASLVPISSPRITASIRLRALAFAAVAAAIVGIAIVSQRKPPSMAVAPIASAKTAPVSAQRPVSEVEPNTVPRVVEPPSTVVRTRAAKPASSGRAILRIRVTPWANVRLDGKPLGETPLGPVEVKPGAHVVVASNPQWQDKRVNVTVAPGENRLVDVSFASRLGAQP